MVRTSRHSDHRPHGELLVGGPNHTTDASDASDADTYASDTTAVLIDGLVMDLANLLPHAGKGSSNHTQSRSTTSPASFSDRSSNSNSTSKSKASASAASPIPTIPASPRGLRRSRRRDESSSTTTVKPGPLPSTSPGRASVPQGSREAGAGAVPPPPPPPPPMGDTSSQDKKPPPPESRSPKAAAAAVAASTTAHRHHRSKNAGKGQPQRRHRREAETTKASTTTATAATTSTTATKPRARSSTPLKHRRRRSPKLGAGGGINKTIDDLFSALADAPCDDDGFLLYPSTTKATATAISIQRKERSKSPASLPGHVVASPPGDSMPYRWMRQMSENRFAVTPLTTSLKKNVVSIDAIPILPKSAMSLIVKESRSVHPSRSPSPRKGRRQYRRGPFQEEKTTNVPPSSSTGEDKGNKTLSGSPLDDLVALVSSSGDGSSSTIHIPFAPTLLVSLSTTMTTKSQHSVDAIPATRRPNLSNESRRRRRSRSQEGRVWLIPSLAHQQQQQESQNPLPERSPTTRQPNNNNNNKNKSNNKTRKSAASRSPVSLVRKGPPPSHLPHEAVEGWGSSLPRLSTHSIAKLSTPSIAKLATRTMAARDHKTDEAIPTIDLASLNRIRRQRLLMGGRGMSTPDLFATNSTLSGSLEDSINSSFELSSTPLRHGRHRRRGSFSTETFADPPVHHGDYMDFVPTLAGPEQQKTTTQAWLRRRLQVQQGEAGGIRTVEDISAEPMAETAQQRREAHVAEQRRRCLGNGYVVLSPRRVSRSVERPTIRRTLK